LESAHPKNGLFGIYPLFWKLNETPLKRGRKKNRPLKKAEKEEDHWIKGITISWTSTNFAGSY